MRIHSDTLTVADLHHAAGYAESLEDGLVTLRFIPRGSRSRAHAFEVSLEGDGTRNKRRRNPGTATWDRDKGYAATWEAWGRFLAYLYAKDANTIAGPYKNRDDFHTQTKGVFL